MAANRLALTLSGLLLVLIGAGWTSTALATPRACDPIVSELQARIAKDLHSGNLFAQEQGGLDLREYTAGIPRRCINAALRPLEQALQDSDDIVRLYAAQAIGMFGPPARSAAPALLAALKLDKCWCLGPGDCMKPSWSSTGAIRVAMIALTGSRGDPYYYSCDYSGGEPIHPGA